MQPNEPVKRSAVLNGILCGLALLLGVIIFFVILQVRRNSAPLQTTATPTSSHTPSKPATEAQVKPASLTLDTTKNYGNKYADGLLPVGDGDYVTDAAKKGSIYVCHANFVPAGQAGAQVRGSWFTTSNTKWDLNKKATIAGSVAWKSSFSNSVSGDTRTILTNDLPSHHTGVFPVAASDPARKYDANPNTIMAQALTYALNVAPTYGNPQCESGEVGVMLSGVALFNGFDAGGRDAGAWEVQDSCDGHPQNKGEYHYHTLSRCITNTGVESIIGYALDGFPITGPKVGTENILTTDDLDVCHGITSEITVDGKKVTTYHYVMTQDFPYSVSCFRSPPTELPSQPEAPSKHP